MDVMCVCGVMVGGTVEIVMIWGYLFAGSLLKDGGGMVMIFESLCSLLIF